MKKLLTLLGLAFALVASLPAQETPPPQTPARTPDQLDQLLGPIALYPDALIALILPASTASADIVLASRYFQAGSDASAVDSQPWDDSVRSLAHYPEIIKWMDQNLAWTKQLGDAFVAQPVDVMQSVQRLRAAARAAGTRVDTPQQQVVIEGDAIGIVPTQPDVIYVPYYDPDVVYVSRSGFYNEPFLTFGVGFPVGAWLSFDLDWGHRRVWYVSRDDRDRYWRDHRDWRHPVFPGRPDYVRDPDRHPWRPSPDVARSPQVDARRLRADVVRPTPLPSAPPHQPAQHQNIPPNGPDNRGRPPQADDRNHERTNTPFNRPGAPAAAVAPTAPVPAPNTFGTRPQMPPPSAPQTEVRHDRNEPGQPDQRGRGHDVSPYFPAAQPVPTTSVAPSAPPAEARHERNDARQPDQRGREFQGNPANRPA